MTLATRLAVAAAVLAVALGPPARAEPVRGRSRLLEAPPEPEAPNFEKLVQHQVGRTIGARLPEVGDGDALRTSIYVTLAVNGAWVWDKPLIGFDRTGSFPAGSLALCPGACAPALRDAAMSALGEHIAWLDNRRVDLPPRFLVMADAELPYGTLLVALRSLTAASRGAPAGMDLLVKTPKGLRAVPIQVPPPGALPVRSTSNPLLLDVTVAPQTWQARASSFYFKNPISIPDVETLESTLGDLKSRDPAKKVIFIGAAEHLPVQKIVKAIDRVRPFYPVVVLKSAAPLVTRTFDPTPP